MARGDASTWAQNNPKFRPSTVRNSFFHLNTNEKKTIDFVFQSIAKLSTYLTGAGAGNENLGLQRKFNEKKASIRIVSFQLISSFFSEYNQGQNVGGQYCVQIAIERTVRLIQ